MIANQYTNSKSGYFRAAFQSVPVLRNEIISDHTGNLYRLPRKQRRAKPCTTGGLNRSGPKKRMAAHGTGRNNLSALIDQNLYSDRTAGTNSSCCRRIWRLGKACRLTIQNTTRDLFRNFLDWRRRRRSCLRIASTSGSTTITTCPTSVYRTLIVRRRGVRGAEINVALYRIFIRIARRDILLFHGDLSEASFGDSNVA